MWFLSEVRNSKSGWNARSQPLGGNVSSLLIRKISPGVRNTIVATE